MSSKKNTKRRYITNETVQQIKQTKEILNTKVDGGQKMVNRKDCVIFECMSLLFSICRIYARQNVETSY